MDDLISRWAAIDALTDTNLKRNVDSVCDGDMNRTRRAAQRVIAQLPAVDAAQVVHARWGESAECSVCGFQPWYEHNIHTLSYCPNCGAKMDGDTNG